MIRHRDIYNLNFETSLDVVHWTFNCFVFVQIGLWTYVWKYNVNICLSCCSVQVMNNSCEMLKW